MNDQTTDDARCVGLACGQKIVGSRYYVSKPYSPYAPMYGPLCQNCYMSAAYPAYDIKKLENAWRPTMSVTEIPVTDGAKELLEQALTILAYERDNEDIPEAFLNLFGRCLGTMENLINHIINPPVHPEFSISPIVEADVDGNTTYTVKTAVKEPERT